MHAFHCHSIALGHSLAKALCLIEVYSIQQKQMPKGLYSKDCSFKPKGQAAAAASFGWNEGSANFSLEQRCRVDIPGRSHNNMR